MPKTNEGRTTDAEANLARRIEHERGKRGMSYEALAKAMTAVGCKIQATAIHKVEKGDKQTGKLRRITVNELTAFAEVFTDGDVAKLLIPIEVLEQQRAQELIAEKEQIDRELWSLTTRMVQAHIELHALDPEIQEYVRGHYGHAYSEEVLIMPDLPEDVRDEVVPALLRFLSAVGNAANEKVLRDQAIERGWHRVEHQ